LCASVRGVGHHGGHGTTAAPMVGVFFLPSFHLDTSRVRCPTTPKPPQNHPLSHLISPSIIGGLGRFKQQSSSHTWWEDVCGVEPFISFVLGLAVHQNQEKIKEKLASKSVDLL